MHIAQSESTRNTPRPRGIRQDNAKRPPNPCSSIAASGLFLLPFDMPVPPPLPLPDFWIGRGAPCEFGCRCGAKPTGAGIGAGLGVTLQYQDDSFRGTPGRLNRGSDSGRARCCSRTGVRRRLQKEKVAKFHKRRLVAKGRKGVHGGHIRRVKRKGMRRRLRGRRVNHRAKKGKIVPVVVQDIAIVPTSSVGPLAALSLSPTLTPSPLSSTSFEEGPEARNAFCDYDDYSCFPSPIPGEGVPTKSLFDEMRECMEMQGVDVPEAFLEFVEYKELEGGGCDVGMNGGGETKRIELTAELEVQGGQILGTACVGSNGAVDTGEERVNLVSPGAKKRVDTDDNWTSGSDLFSMLSVDCDRPLSTDLSKNALDTPVSLRFLASLAFLTGSRGEETERKIPEAVGEEECTSGTATNCGGTGLRARIPHTKHTMRVVAVVEEGQAQKEDVYVVKSDVRKAEQGAKRVPDEVAVAAEEGIPEMNTTKKGDILKGWSANAVAEGVALASQGGNGDSRREVREESRCLTLIKFTPLSDSAALEQCRGPLSSAKPRTKMMMDVMWSHSSSHRTVLARQIPRKQIQSPSFKVSWRKIRLRRLVVQRRCTFLAFRSEGSRRRIQRGDVRLGASIRMPRRGDHYPVIAHRRYTEMVIATSHSISRHHHGVAIDGGPHCPNLSLCGPRVIDAHFHHTHRFMNKPPQVVFRLYRLGKLIPRQQRFQPKRPQCLPRPASIPLVPTLCPPGSIYITISTSICTRSASKPVQPQWSGPSFVRQPKDPALFRVASLHDTVGAVSANNCAEDARIASAFLILRNIFQRFAHLPRAGGLPYAAVIRHGAGPLDQAPNGSLSRLQCPQLLLDPGPPPNGSLEPTQEAYTSYIKSGCKRLKNFPVLVQFCSAPNLTVVLYPGFLFPVQRP